MPPAIRVLVVDDSVVVRRVVADVLSADPQIDVVGTAANGRLALAKVDHLRPDLITMDVKMPVLDGIETVRALRAERHRMPIVMFSALTDRGAAATLEALAAGASDYVTKPANLGSGPEPTEHVRRTLLPMVKALMGRAATAAPDGRPTLAHPASVGPAPTHPATLQHPSAGRPPRTFPTAPAARTEPYRVVVIGSSTGGPEALSTLLCSLPATLPVPVLVVQHMPPVFTRQLAARLDRSVALDVVESAGDEPLEPGRVYIAPGDNHLELLAAGAHVRTRLTKGPPESSCRPAVDVLFRSAAHVYGPGVLAVVLTGMGSDGRRGAQRIVASGGSVLAQDEATSVVWGMPGAVATAGLAEEVLPLSDLAPALVARLLGAPARRAAPARTGSGTP